MNSGCEPNLIDPHEYEGLIFDMPQDLIPIRLARECVRVGAMSVWEYQSFVHHDHPCSSDEALPDELAQADEWRRILSDRFPNHKFVIEIQPMDRITWFQALGDAPTEDETDWKLYSPPVVFQFGDFHEQIKDLAEGSAETDRLREAMKQSMRDAMSADRRRIGSKGKCEKCGSEAGFSERFQNELHRGIQNVVCLACHAILVHSTRTIRNSFGSVPEP